MYSLLERYLDALDNTLEKVCQALGEGPVEALVTGAINTYIDVKFANVDLAAALYAAAIQTGASAIVKRTSDRCCKALSCALAQSTGYPETATAFPAVMIFSSMAEATRAVLLLGAIPEQIRKLREHLSLLCCSYVRVWLNEQIPSSLLIGNRVSAGEPNNVGTSVQLAAPRGDPRDQGSSPERELGSSRRDAATTIT